VSAGLLHVVVDSRDQRDHTAFRARWRRAAWRARLPGQWRTRGALLPLPPLRQVRAGAPVL